MEEEKGLPGDHSSLEKRIPKLKEFLKRGISVLDIGCGKGTIAADVADAVSPGRVVGLNTTREDDQIARQTAIDRGTADNISFVIGDSHSLDFDDNSFDLVYSYAAAHFFIDPVKALKEQARVTKENGYVVAAGVRDIGPRYPRCENWEKVWEAWVRFSDNLREEYKKSNTDPESILRNHIQNTGNWMYHFDIQAGRKCVEWFSRAGFADISISVEISQLRYPKNDLMTPRVMDFIEFEDMTEHRKEFIRRFHSRMIEAGFIDKKTCIAAEEEAAAWIKNPFAMNYFVFVFASGRASS